MIYLPDQKSDDKFHRGSDDGGEKEAEDIMFFYAVKKKIKKNPAHAIDGKPWTIEKTAFADSVVPKQGKRGFP